VLLDFDTKAAASYFSLRVPLSLWAIAERWQQWGEQKGFPRSLEEERVFFEDFWDNLCDEFGLTKLIRSELHQFDYTAYFTVYPDVVPALQLARAKGLKIGVLSNFALASLEQSLKTTGLWRWIDLACAATVIGASKPEHAAYAIAAERLGVALEQCLFLDDEPVNVAGAEASGMQAYIVDRSLSVHEIVARKLVDLSALGLLLS